MDGIYFLVAFLASVLGKICGMGGGVMIKPVLDACHTASVAAINFYSGCTVLGMSCWSVGKAAWRRDNLLDFRVSVPLAAGAALGGLLGKEIYCQLASLYTDAEVIGGVQALFLFLVNLGDSALHHHKGPLSRKTGPALVPLRCRWIGLGNSGFIFGGLGGGPFNMAVLYYFFSMSTKTAAQNSLFVILISQGAGTLKTILAGDVPDILIPILVGMILCGVAGSEVGGRLNRRLSEENVTRLFQWSMVLVLGINLYNMFRFFGLAASDTCREGTSWMADCGLLSISSR